MQSPFINQFIGNSVLEAAPYPGSRTASSILAIVTNFYIFTFRGKKKKVWKCHYSLSWLRTLKVGSVSDYRQSICSLALTFERQCWVLTHCSWYRRQGAEGCTEFRMQGQSICLREPHCCSGCQLLKQCILALLEKPRMNDSRD